MSYNSIITNLFFVLIYADGKVDDKEIASGNRMVKVESLNESEFHVQLQYLKSKDTSVVLLECLSGLRELEREQQIRIIAWLCVVANADGFMDTAEWKLIYRIYRKELNLPLDEIFKIQKGIECVRLQNLN